MLEHLILPVDVLVERTVLCLVALHEFRRRQSARRCVQFGLMKSFERLSFAGLSCLEFTMRGLVAPELVERHGRLRWSHGRLAWGRSCHFRFPHNRAIDVDRGLPIERYTCSTW